MSKIIINNSHSFLGKVIILIVGCVALDENEMLEPQILIPCPNRVKEPIIDYAWHALPIEI